MKLPLHLRSSLLLLGALACGGDDEPTNPGGPNVTGVWTASLSNLTGGGATCSSTEPTQLTLEQDGNAFTGTYSGGELTCSGSAGTFTSPLGDGIVINGQVTDNEVSFDLDTPDYHQDGTLNGASMSGTATWRFDFGPGTGVVTLNGTWGAARQ